MSVEQKIVDDIKNYGWHVINVVGTEAWPLFSYTIGLYKSFNSPELFISGLDGNVAHNALNNIASEIRSGKKIETKIETKEFFDGYGCYFDLVDQAHYDDYFGKAIWFYQGYDFPVLQCVWPNKLHLYPWQTEQGFKQDVLIKAP